MIKREGGRVHKPVQASRYQKYRHRGKHVTLVGVNFDSRQRQISEWLAQADQPQPC